MTFIGYGGGPTLRRRASEGTLCPRRRRDAAYTPQTGRLWWAMIKPNLVFNRTRRKWSSLYGPKGGLPGLRLPAVAVYRNLRSVALPKAHFLSLLLLDDDKRGIVPVRSRSPAPCLGPPHRDSDSSNHLSLHTAMPGTRPPLWTPPATSLLVLVGIPISLGYPLHRT